MASDRPSFVYTIYIASTPEKVFAALTDPEMTKSYWGHHRNASDWTQGAKWRHEDYSDPSIVHIVGEVIETVPPKRLVISWASPGDEHEPGKVSRVTFHIDMFMDSVKLTVTHEDLEPDSEMLRGISFGWPAVLSSLKTMLETGQPLPGTDRRWGRGERPSLSMPRACYAVPFGRPTLV